MAHDAAAAASLGSWASGVGEALLPANRLKSIGSRDKLVKHVVYLFFMHSSRLECGEVLKVSEQRQHYLIADGRSLYFGHDQAQMLYCAGTPTLP